MDNFIKRLLIAPARSGTNATSNALAQNDAHEVRVHGIKNYYGIRPKYNFYTDEPLDGKTARISVESIGPLGPAVSYRIFRTPQDILDTKPVFMLRDPFETWKSQKTNKGMKPFLVGQFLKGYQRVHRMACDALNLENADAACITSEELRDPIRNADVLKQLCKRWGIDYSPEMIDWRYTYDGNPNLSGKLKGKYNSNARRTKKLGDKYTSKGSGVNLTVSEGKKLETLMPLYIEFRDLSQNIFPATSN